MDKWDARWIDAAWGFAMWSKHPTTQVGCVVVGPDREIRASGYNGFPRGLDDARWLALPPETRHLLMVHAEANAVAAAARVGVRLKGCTAYVTHPPCSRCAALLIQAGVERIVWPREVSLDPKWREDCDLAIRALRAAGISTPGDNQCSGTRSRGDDWRLPG